MWNHSSRELFESASGRVPSLDLVVPRSRGSVGRTPAAENLRNRRITGASRASACLGFVFVLGCPTAEQASDGGVTATAEAPAPSRVELLVEPFPDLYFAVRSEAAEPGISELALGEAAQAWSPIRDHIGDFGGFWRLDLPGLLTRNPEEFGDWVATLDEDIEGRSGGTIPIRSPAERIAEALRRAWPDYIDAAWKQRQRVLANVLDELEDSFVPRQQAAFEFMLDSLDIEDPHLRVPLYLVTRTNPPGAMTYRSREGPLVVLGVEQAESVPLLMETILHEACHALDGASSSEGNAFADLRSLLEERGVGRGDPRWQAIPHLLMFVQAEETIRRLFNPDHIAYGDTPRGGSPGVYARSEGQAEVIREEWRAKLDGEKTTAQALQAIVRTLVSENSASG